MTTTKSRSTVDSLSCSDDQLARFKASGWSASRIDGHDPEAIAAAIRHARHDSRPSLIACRTVIGFGAPNRQGTEKAHGAPLGADEIEKTRSALDWPHAPFQVPEAVTDAWREIGTKDMRRGGHGSSAADASVRQGGRRSMTR
jgi:Transketolase